PRQRAIDSATASNQSVSRRGRGNVSSTPSGSPVTNRPRGQRPSFRECNSHLHPERTPSPRRRGRHGQQGPTSRGQAETVSFEPPYPNRDNGDPQTCNHLCATECRGIVIAGHGPFRSRQCTSPGGVVFASG